MHIQLQFQPATSIDADVLVVGLTVDQTSFTGAFAGLDEALDGVLSDMVRHGELTGKLKEMVSVHTFGKIKARRLFIVGLGDESKLNGTVIRDAAAQAIRQANCVKAKTVAVVLPGVNHPQVHAHFVTHSFVEGALLGDYHFAGYGTKREELSQVTELIMLVPEVTADLTGGIDCGTAYAEGTNFARNLVNTPGNKMTPTVMAAYAVELAKRHGMDYEVLERADMERLGMGGLLAVAQGSPEPPKMIVLKYQGDESAAETLGFVGKGITFDTGGISIKPAASMDDMKMDMGGGAAVLGAMEAIGRLRPKVNVIAVVPCTENMPSGTAYKPGDVIHTMSGKTIEVLNTDAEGRIVLADGLTYARKLGATRLVDLATLTGAVLVALGKEATAAMTNDDSFLQDFMKSAKTAGERVWELPTYDEYFELIRSDIADVKNTGGRHAGTITAGLFLREFAEDTPWIHLDIAGTAWLEKGTNTMEKGATGVMVRSLVQLAKHYGKHGFSK